jgi:hypothetical protein
MEPDGPVLSYASPGIGPRRWRLILAAKAAGLFAIFSFVFGIFASLVIGPYVEPQESLPEYFTVQWILILMFSALSFLLAALSCWIRLATGTHSLTRSRFRYIWLFAAVYVGAAAYVTAPIEPLRQGISLYREEELFIWSITYLACSCFFLLRRTQLEGVIIN